MNAAERLAREIYRVAVIRAHYEDMRGTPGVNIEFAVHSMSASLERACKAAGADDAIEVLAAIKDLAEYSE